MSKTIHKIEWDKAHYLWSDFKLGSDYAQYLLDEYGITVEATGRVRWDKVFTVEVVIEINKGAGGGNADEPKKAKRKMKAKREEPPLERLAGVLLLSIPSYGDFSIGSRQDLEKEFERSYGESEKDKIIGDYLDAYKERKGNYGNFSNKDNGENARRYF